jgi:hypothetical protein
MQISATPICKPHVICDCRDVSKKGENTLGKSPSPRLHCDEDDRLSSANLPAYPRETQTQKGILVRIAKFV